MPIRRDNKNISFDHIIPQPQPAPAYTDRSAHNEVISNTMADEEAKTAAHN